MGCVAPIKVLHIWLFVWGGGRGKARNNYSRQHYNHRLRGENPTVQTERVDAVCSDLVSSSKLHTWMNGAIQSANLQTPTFPLPERLLQNTPQSIASNSWQQLACADLKLTGKFPFLCA